MHTTTREVFRPDHTSLGGWQYPYLAEYGLDWAISSTDAERAGLPNDATLDGFDHWNTYWIPGNNATLTPTLRWVNDRNVHDLYVFTASGDVMTLADFQARTHLRFEMGNGGMVTSKRISRIMRRYAAYGFFRKHKIKVLYLDQSEFDAKVWDGAGLVSRRMLRRLISQVPESLPDRRRRKIIRELHTCKRVEFTLLGVGENGGQDKGHAIVVEDLDGYDFILPRDTKAQVQQDGSKAFVGINFVHGANEMRLDMQSLINLHPFFDTDYLLTCLRQESDLFITGVENGEIDAALNRIDTLESVDDLGDWYILEYLASGGQTMWFASVVRGIIGQHLKRLSHTNLGKMRLPIHGGRYYVMPVGVAARGGIVRNVQPGQVYIDPIYATIWVNDADWVNHISGVLGGADNDDALWVHPFVDTDGTETILYWRSPNQPGEYMLATPATDSHPIMWDTIDGVIPSRSADSAHLPTRIDRVRIDYQHLIDADSAGGIGEGDDYGIEVMQSVIQRTMKNGGVLGGYCNVLMIAQAVWNRLPAHPPAPLEAVIDASVKTGADLSRVGHWCNDAKHLILKRHIPVPRVLHDRVSTTYPVAATHNHWLDTLHHGVQAHITYVEVERERLARATTPPVAVMDAGARWQPYGIELRQRYASAHRPNEHGHFEFHLEVARERSEHYLAAYPVEQQRFILLGALYDAYMGTHATARKDSAAWQLGTIAQLTLAALRDIEVLHCLADATEGGVLSFTQGIDTPVALPITLNGVWLNLLQHQTGITYPRMRDVATNLRDRYKRMVADMARAGAFDGRTLTVRILSSGRKVLVNAHGVVIGYVANHDTARLTSETVTIRKAAGDGDGNLRLII